MEQQQQMEPDSTATTLTSYWVGVLNEAKIGLWFRVPVHLEDLARSTHASCSAFVAAARGTMSCRCHFRQCECPLRPVTLDFLQEHRLYWVERVRRDLCGHQGFVRDDRLSEEEATRRRLAAMSEELSSIIRELRVGDGAGGPDGGGVGGGGGGDAGLD
jgi:hypothetical protein